MMNWNNSLTKIRRLSTQLSVVSVGLLLMITTSVIYFICFIYPNNMLYQQSIRPIMNLMVDNTQIEKLLRDTKNLDETIDVLFQEKKVLEAKINTCQNEKKGLTNSLETEKEIHRKANATYVEKLKLCQQEIKNQTTNASTSAFDPKLFNYMATFLRDTPYPGVENYTRYTVARLGMSPLAGVEPLKPEYGPVLNDFTSFRYRITIAPCQNVTKTSGNNRNVVVIVVNSAPGNFDKRNTIRQTWRNHLKNVEYHKDLITIAGFAFILGLTDNKATQMKIEEESKTHKDIIQIEIADIYRRMAVKVAGLFHWLNRNCAKVDFVLKVDDDVYVNVGNLAHFVAGQQSHLSNQNIFGSYVGYGTDYIPNREGKFIITHLEWPWARYPRFFNGPGVLISGSSILPLLASMQTTPIMPFDDVYYIGICTEKTGIKLHFSSKSTSVFSMECPDLSRPCNPRRFISWLTSSADQMNKSHVAIEDFYSNKTQCVVTGTNGTSPTIVDHNEPVHFDFDIYFHPVS